MIELSQPSPDRWTQGTELGARIERQLDLQKVAILVADPATPGSAVPAVARHDGVPVRAPPIRHRPPMTASP